MTIDDEVATAGAECDDRLDRLQPDMIAALRQHGIADVDLPAALAWAHHEYWQERIAILARYRALLVRVSEMHP